MKYRTILLACCFQISSCALLLGFHQPEKLTTQQLIKYEIKNKMDTTHSLVFLKKAYDSIQTLPYKPNWQKGFRPLQFQAYNNSGKIVAQFTSCEGSLKKLKTLSEFPPKNKWPFDSSMNLSKQMQLYRGVRGQLPNINYTQSDLTILVYWGTWLGYPGRNLIHKLQDYRSKYINKKITIIYINVLEREIEN